MNDNRLTTEALQAIADSFHDVGRNLAQLGDRDRRRTVGAIVAAIGHQCPVAVADLAACASFTVLTVGGAK